MSAPVEGGHFIPNTKRDEFLKQRKKLFSLSLILAKPLSSQGGVLLQREFPSFGRALLARGVSSLGLIVVRNRYLCLSYDGPCWKQNQGTCGVGKQELAHRVTAANTHRLAFQWLGPHLVVLRVVKNICL